MRPLQLPANLNILARGEGEEEEEEVVVVEEEGDRPTMEIASLLWVLATRTRFNLKVGCL